MEDNTKGFDSKKEFDAIADSETANLKITLLEKHLMESREAALELKRQELELRDKQLAIIAQMQNAVEENKAIDKRLADKIDESIEAVRTDMFTAWQESVKEAIVADARQLVESKLEEYDVIYRKQNEIIALQTKQADRILSTYRLFKGLCSVLIAVAIIVFALIPAGIYAYDQISAFLSEPSWWGGVLLAVCVVLLSLGVAIAVLLRRKERDK